MDNIAMKTLKHNHRNGWVLLEATTALFILGLIFTGLAYGVNASRRANCIQHARQKCIVASGALLECICLRNRPLNPSHTGPRQGVFEPVFLI